MSAFTKLRLLLWTSGWWGFWSAIICGGMSIACVSYASMRPSVVIVDLHEVDGVAVRGGFIQLQATIDRTRNCPSDIQRWLWRDVQWPDGKMRPEFISLEAPRSPPVPIGRDEYVLSIPVPPNVPDGKWFYRGVAHENCSWLPGFLQQSGVRQTVDVPITISSNP